MHIDDGTRLYTSWVIEDAKLQYIPPPPSPPHHLPICLKSELLYFSFANFFLLHKAGDD